MFERIRQLPRRIFQAALRRLQHKPQPFVYVALGDSTVEGVGASHTSRSYAHLLYNDLSRHYKQVTYFNLGKRGARVEHVLQNQIENAVKAQPMLVTLSIGANDVLGRTSLRHFRQRLDRLLSMLSRETGALIVITNIPDFSFAKRVPAALKPVFHLRIRQYNRIIKNAAEKYGAILVDTFRESGIIARRFPNAVSDDNFHPSDFGYALWANTMLTIIYEHLKHHRHWWQLGPQS